MHLTLLLVFLIFSHVAGGTLPNVMLHWLEIGSLSALLSTLWAASVFSPILTAKVMERGGMARCHAMVVLSDVVITGGHPVSFARQRRCETSGSMFFSTSWDEA